MTLRLRRSFLYMPAHIERMVRKAVLEVKPGELQYVPGFSWHSGTCMGLRDCEVADVVCMDCEDSVDAVKKAAAREAVPGHLKDLNFGRCEVPQQQFAARNI